MSISEPLYTTTDFTFAGSTDYAARTDIGTTNMTMVAGNFTNTNTNFNPVTFNVTNGSITITPIINSIVITAATDSKVYDATALTNDGYTFTDGVLVGNDVLTAVVEGTQTVVGSSANSVTSYEIKRGTETVTSNYTGISTVNGTLEVTKRPLTITANDYTVMYDGMEHTYAENTNPILTIEAEGTNTGLLAAHHLADTTMTGARTNAGTETIAISAAVIKDASDNNVTANYDLHFVDGTLTITKRTGVVVTIQEHGKEVDYNATDQKVTGYSVASIADPVSLYTVADFRFVGIASDTIAHGTGAEDALHVYDMNLRPEHFENTNPNYDTVTFVIRDSALYIYPKMKVSLLPTDFTNTNTNYTVNFVITDGTLTITPKSTPIVITAGSRSKIYDGTALTDATFTYTDGVLATGDVLHTTNAGSITHVGIVTNSIATYWVTNNADQDVTHCYTFGSPINGQLEINTRPVTLTSATDSKVYDGMALTNTHVTPSTGANVGFVGTEGATYNVTGSITDVGTATNMFTYSLTTDTRATDYNISVVYGTLTVTPKDGITVNITGNHNTLVYDGQPKTVTGYTVDAGTWNTYYSASDVTCDTTATATQTVTGTKNMGLATRHFHNTNPNFTNVNFVVTDGYMTITSITEEIVVTTATDTKMYDGTALTNGGFTYTGTLADGDVLEVVTNGTVTHVHEGAVNNTIASCKVKRGSEDVTANYHFGTPVLGTLTITKRDVTLTSGSAIRNFNGAPLKAETVTVSGSGFVSGEEPTAYTNYASRTDHFRDVHQHQPELRPCYLQYCGWFIGDQFDYLTGRGNHHG